MNWFDAAFERSARAAAQRTSRRSAIARLGRLLLGASVALPVLPFDRSAHAAKGHGGSGGAKGANAVQTDDKQCDYWKYCGVDGFLCSCCGGSVNSCPPGTEPSKVSWIGTCRNPVDGKDYLISYFDCCGKNACGRCLCNTNLGERPAYRITLHNDINWCMGSTSTMFHCTTSLVIGVAEKS
jgi:methylamine dehydrogenase light chain